MDKRKLSNKIEAIKIIIKKDSLDIVSFLFVRTTLINIKEAPIIIPGAWLRYIPAFDIPPGIVRIIKNIKKIKL